MNPRSRRRYRTPASVSLAAGIVMWGAVMSGVGCAAPPEPDDFTVDNETGFLAACVEPLSDTALTIAVCGCVFEKVSNAYSFVEFEELDLELKVDLGAKLPAEVEAIIASCVIEEADL